MSRYAHFEPRKRRRINGVAPFLAVVIVAALIILAIFAFHKTRHVVAKVTDKQRVCTGSHNGNSSCKYLIFTDHGTLKDTDSWAFFKFDSSDVYGRIQTGHTYDFKVYGVRVGLTSSYPNIVSAKEVHGS